MNQHKYDAAMIQIAGKNMPKDAAIRVASIIILMRDTNPKAKITLWVAGYDEDPREVWEIPEVREQILKTMGLILTNRPTWDLEDLNLDDSSLAIVGMCSDKLKIVGTNRETGEFIMVPTNS